jgi:ATP-dependent Zn protease
MNGSYILQASGTRIRSQLTAYHEAGHAVVALHCGLGVAAMGISRSDPDRGLTVTRRAFVNVPEQFGHPSEAGACWLRVVRLAEQVAMTALAGPLAEAKMLGAPLRSLGATSDFAQALSICEALTEVRQALSGHTVLPDGNERDFLDRMCRRTRRLLAHPKRWRAVEELARDLLGWGVLSGADVAETVAWAHRPRGQLGLLS